MGKAPFRTCDSSSDPGNDQYGLQVGKGHRSGRMFAPAPFATVNRKIVVQHYILSSTPLALRFVAREIASVYSAT